VQPVTTDQLNTPIDGLTLNPYTVVRPYDYHVSAMAQMDTLRRANTYRPRWYCVPDDFNQPIEAYGTLEYQIKVTAGSYLWGIKFAQFSATSTWITQAPTGITLQITEACTGLELFSEFTHPAGFAFYTGSAQARGWNMPHLLTQPRLFLEPGNIDIELCNLGSSTQRCQLILHFAEPIEYASCGGGIDRGKCQ
jgi:hypothetical protein